MVNLARPALLEPRRVTVGKPPDFLTVACVWQGTRYPFEYVKKLRSMVRRNLSIAHHFVCLTDNVVSDPTIDVLRTPKVGDGWWHKMHLFMPQAFNGRVLYFDLDVVVFSSLDELASAQEDFCMIENFGPNKAHSAHNSSVMLWTPNAQTDRMYEDFWGDSRLITRELHGDQCYIWRALNPYIWNWDREQVISYKYEKVKGWQHRGPRSSVLVFHGEPKPHQVNDSLVTAHWR